MRKSSTERVGGLVVSGNEPMRARAGFTVPLVMAALVGLAALTGIAPAHATSAPGNGAIACGDVITTDTTLHADLVDCPNKGIVIGADGVTLNLHGHTIDGDMASDCPEEVVCDIGVDNVAGHDGLVLKGGTVQEFNVGVLASGDVTGVRLHDLSVSYNEYFGVIVEGSTDSVISDNTFIDNGICALILTGAQRAVVTGNSASGSHGYAFVFAPIVDGVVQDNVLDNNDHGILMVAGSSGDRVVHNTIRHTSGSSIDLGEGAAGNRVEHNRLIDNGDGIIGSDVHDNVISHNTVTGTGFFGFQDTGGFGIVLDGAARTTLEANTVTGGRGPAIFVTTLEAPTVSRDNVLSRNLVSSKLDDGIHVDSGATGTRIESNVANGSGDDGIDVEVPSATLRSNIANRNSDLGIEAAPGVTDAGNNRAAGNGNAAQCINVFCR
jgi:parallel beta-helix repeat protein